MKYTIIKSNYSSTPYFCITATGLRILKALAGLEMFATLEADHEDYDIPCQELMNSEKFQKAMEDFDFEDYLSEMYSAHIEESEEPVEAWYSDDDLIDFYASGKAELSDCLVVDNFDFPEEYSQPLEVVRDNTFRYNAWIVVMLVIMVVLTAW